MFRDVTQNATPPPVVVARFAGADAACPHLGASRLDPSREGRQRCSFVANAMEGAAMRVLTSLPQDDLRKTAAVHRPPRRPATMAR